MALFAEVKQTNYLRSKEVLTFIFIFLLHSFSFAQLPDTVFLKEVTVKSYFGKRPYLRLPSSVSIVDSNQFANQHGQSLVPVLNTAPGVRMEERSPGSYRLSIRGSLLRSPFGIRNIKVYMDEFPLTDAGGNTYLNLMDVNSINRIELLKGPDGSLFGANSGGVVRLSIADEPNDRTQIATGVDAGSYALFHEHATLKSAIGKHIFSISRGWQTSKGYRRNSALKRAYFQLTDKWNYTNKAQLKFFFFYADLDYQTPGGLTLKQWQDDPHAARPATSKFHSAEEQHAGVHNKTFYGGLMHEVKFNNHLKHVVAVFATHTDFENPFITNYEVRDEKTAGVRTWLEFTHNKQGKINLSFNLGGEAQQTQSRIDNYGNLLGNKDTVQVADHLNATQGFAFARASADFYNRLIIETSVSLNSYRYLFKKLQPSLTNSSNRIFTPQAMPKFAISFLISQSIAFRATISRGYSPPTLAEIRPSTNIITTTLQPESGWNYEIGFRIHDKHDRIWWDGAVFYYHLQNAIVRRVSETGEEFFVNAGGTKQPGIESQLLLKMIKESKGFIKNLHLSNSYTFNYFKFSNYQSSGNDYSGNYLTGVSDQIIVTALMIELPLQFFIFSQHTYIGHLPLNDSNSDYASSYRLLQIKAGWKTIYHTNFTFQLTAGVDNLLNENYSLGNDLNSVGSRYYNPAPKRNYFFGVQFNWR